MNQSTIWIRISYLKWFMVLQRKQKLHVKLALLVMCGVSESHQRILGLHADEWQWKGSRQKTLHWASWDRATLNLSPSTFWLCASHILAYNYKLIHDAHCSCNILHVLLLENSALASTSYILYCLCTSSNLFYLRKKKKTTVSLSIFSTI